MLPFSMFKIIKVSVAFLILVAPLTLSTDASAALPQRAGMGVCSAVTYSYAAATGTGGLYMLFVLPDDAKVIGADVHQNLNTAAHGSFEHSYLGFDPYEDLVAYFFDDPNHYGDGYPLVQYC